MSGPASFFTLLIVALSLPACQETPAVQAQPAGDLSSAAYLEILEQAKAKITW